MGMPSGVAAQMGFGKETTPGTRVVPDHFLEFVQEAVDYRRTYLQSRGLSPGRRGDRGATLGNVMCEGSVAFELQPASTGLLLELCMGGVATSGAGPYVHTFTPGDLPAATFQFGKPPFSTSDPLIPHDFLGSYVNEWTLSLDATGDGNLAEFQVDLRAMNLVRGQALATPTYATPVRWSSLDAYVVLDGSAYKVDNLTLSGNNALRVHHQTDATAPGVPTISEEGRRAYSGTMVADYLSDDAFDLFVNGTVAPLVITLGSGSNELVITMSCRYEGRTPNVAGEQVVKQELSFVGEDTTSDANVITMALTNGDATP